MRDLFIHPAGRHIAYTRGGNRSEIGAMENFLPPTKLTSPAAVSQVKK
jgi:hypothetical protein